MWLMQALGFLLSALQVEEILKNLHSLISPYIQQLEKLAEEIVSELVCVCVCVCVCVRARVARRQGWVALCVGYGCWGVGLELTVRAGVRGPSWASEIQSLV